ncbi:MAG: TldD/PmbA family protein [Candidatus Woesearchaeota archaeon]
MLDTARKIGRKLTSAGADDSIVTISEELKTQLKFSNSKISATQTWKSLHIGLFAAIGKRLVSTSIEDYSDKAVDTALKKIMAFASATQQNSEYMGIAEGPFRHKQIERTYDEAIENLGEKGVDLVDAGIIAGLSRGAKKVAGVLETTTSKTWLHTSNNVDGEEKGTTIHFSCRAFSDKDASGHYVSTARMLSDLKIEQAAENAAAVAKKAVGPERISEGKYDVLFEPLAAANIIEQVAHAASVFNVEAGLSCLNGKIGKMVGSENVTVIDDATLPGTAGAAKFDAEGVPTQRNTIIENGIMKTYLHNTSTAKRYKTSTTANAGIIAPEPFNIIFKTGSFIKDELFERIKRGLWITNVWYTRFMNYESGDFSTIPRDGAFLIENGRIVKPVKDIRISENLLNMLRNVSAVGAEAEQITGWEVETPIFMPPMIVKNVNITKSVE